MGKLLLLSLLFSVQLFSQAPKPAAGYEIKVQLKPYQHTRVYLGYFFGDHIPVVDSALLDNNSEAVFKGPNELAGGIYMLYFKDQPGYVDMLIDKSQHFTVVSDLSSPTHLLLRYENSPENAMFNEYKHFMAYRELDINYARTELGNAKNHSDSMTCINQLKELDKTISDFRDGMIAKNAGSFFATLLEAMREPYLPASLQHPVDANDSLVRNNFLKEHFWEGVNFWDGRLANTPFLANKLDRYFEEILEKNEDSVIKKIDWMMGYAAASENMTHFLLDRLVSKSMDHHYKWGDAVLIHLFEKYIANRNYSWLSIPERQRISEKAYFLMGDHIGKPAPGIVLKGIEDKAVALYNQASRYTIVCFWDVTCDHCKQTLPALDSLYRAQWKKNSISIFAVSVETMGTKNDWQQFIEEKNLEGWKHAYQSVSDEQQRMNQGLMSYSQLYDVWSFPSFFVLDNEKRFVAKKLYFKQLAELVSSLIKK